MLYLRDKYDIVPFWFNPNIHPYQEFERRLNAFKKATEKSNPIIDNTYNLMEYFKAVKWGSKRCDGCYQLRLEKTAKVASEQKVGLFSSTMLISPYQDISLISEIGDDEAKKVGINFLAINLRKYYREGHRIAKEMGIYMQNYCGCIFSEEERFREAKNGRR